MKLVDFINSNDFVVLAWRAYPNQNTQRLPTALQECSSILDDWGLFDLNGRVEGGCWTWDGTSESQPDYAAPADYKGNQLSFIQAYPDEKAWIELVNEWMSIPF